jgi:hypothetical protein
MVRTPQGGIAFDPGHALPGRGAHVCPALPCLAAALTTRRLRWAFRRETTAPPLDEAVADLITLLDRALAGLLGMAARSGNLIHGHDAVLREMDAGRARLVVAAGDLAPRSRRDLESGKAPVVTWGTLESLGAAIGRPGTGIVAVTQPSLAGRIADLHAKGAAIGPSRHSKGGST